MREGLCLLVGLVGCGVYEEARTEACLVLHVCLDAEV